MRVATHLFVLLQKLIVFLLKLLLQCGYLLSQLSDRHNVVGVAWNQTSLLDLFRDLRHVRFCDVWALRTTRCTRIAGFVRRRFLLRLVSWSLLLSVFIIAVGLFGFSQCSFIREFTQPAMKFPIDSMVLSIESARLLADFTLYRRPIFLLRRIAS